MLREVGADLGGDTPDMDRHSGQNVARHAKAYLSRSDSIHYWAEPFYATRRREITPREQKEDLVISARRGTMSSSIRL